jgi:hypothetical protein
LPDEGTFDVLVQRNGKLHPRVSLREGRQERRAAWDQLRLSLPPTITEHVKDFGLFMLAAVLKGCGDEVIDLARVNPLR